MDTNNFYNLSTEEVEKHFNTNADTELSEQEARERLNTNGYNEFTKKKHKSTFRKFLDQFKSFMIIVLIIAAAISGVTGYLNGEGITDAIIILFIVILNAIIHRYGTGRQSRKIARYTGKAIISPLQSNTQRTNRDYRIT